MGVGKTMAHLRELAAERMYKQPTELPPDYTALERKFTARAQALENAVRMSKQTFGFQGNRAAQTNFGESLINYGAEFDDDEPLSYALVKGGELQEHLAANQETFETITRANYLAYWNRLLESDVAVARRAIEKVHKRRLEFDSYNTGRDRMGFFEIRPDSGSKYMEAGRNLQAAIDIARTHMQRVVYHESATQLRTLQDLIGAQAEYYRACLEEIERIKQHVQGQQTWATSGESKPLNRATRRMRFFTSPPPLMPLQAQTQIYRQPAEQRNQQLVAPLTTLLTLPVGVQAAAVTNVRLATADHERGALDVGGSCT